MKTSRVLSNRTALVLLIMSFSLAACEIETFEDASEGFGGSTPPPGPPPPPPPPSGGFGPNFSEIQSNVFTPDCATSGCHSGANPSASLNLEAANSYAELVGIASTQNSGIQRVVAGDPVNSYLMQKLEGASGISGGVMPPGAAGPLLQTSIDTIRQWISDGAIDDMVQPPVAPIRVNSLSPVPGATLAAGPAQIVAGFDRELDQTSVNANTFILRGSGGDATFADGNEVQIAAASISVPAANPQSAVFDLTGVVLADDTYRISLLGAGASLIMDLDANALDGEFAGAFPSGDGTAGGDFNADFTVMQPVAAPIRVVSLSPVPGTDLAAGPAQIVAGFDSELDPATVNVNTFILTGSGGDATFADGNEVQIAAASITVPAANPQTAIFDLTGVVLADDTYRVSLLGSGASLIMDLNANALDGEFAGVFPSGNGVAGGDFNAQFSVTTPVVIGPTLDQIQAVVFTPTCATVTCHTGPAGGVLPGGLDLSNADASFASLVGVPSIQQAAVLRVAIADPNNSYLIQKLEGAAGITGARMPFGGAALDPAVIAEIRQWILDGAVR